jgi:hypothetical protein
MNLSPLDELSTELENHPLFARINSLEELRFFMQHHAYAVWDFMSLLKKLQEIYAPHGSPWVPASRKNGQLTRFINEIVTEEESDLAFESDGNTYSSHFEIYLQSMDEISCSTQDVLSFVDTVRSHGLEAGLNFDKLPSSSLKFMRHTFDLIDTGKSHEIAASFSLARESVIPLMFKRILALTKVSKEDAPVFHYYLERHAELDGDHHGPMAERILEELCANDPLKETEVLAQAKASIEARISLWDEVLLALDKLPSLVIAT